MRKSDIVCIVLILICVAGLNWNWEAKIKNFMHQQQKVMHSPSQREEAEVQEVIKQLEHYIRTRFQNTLLESNQYLEMSKYYRYAKDKNATFNFELKNLTISKDHKTAEANIAIKFIGEEEANTCKGKEIREIVINAEWLLEFKRGKKRKWHISSEKCLYEESFDNSDDAKGTRVYMKTPNVIKAGQQYEVELYVPESNGKIIIADIDNNEQYPNRGPWEKLDSNSTMRKSFSVQNYYATKEPISACILYRDCETCKYNGGTLYKKYIPVER